MAHLQAVNHIQANVLVGCPCWVADYAGAIIIDREQDVRRGDSGVQWAECESQVNPYLLTV